METQTFGSRGVSGVDDVLVDRMRGRCSIWTSTRISLRHVPEDLHEQQAMPDRDDDPTRTT